MKKGIIVLGIVIAIGIAYWLISPLFLQKKVNESLKDIVGTMPVVSSQGRTLPSGESSPAYEPSPPGAPNTVVPPPSPGVVIPAEPSQPVAMILTQGTFVGLARHTAEGQASVVQVGEKYYVRFEDDFRVTNGPDLFVYLGKNDEYDPATRLGRLKGSMGGQNYEVPAGVDVSEYNEVWVWCRAFSVPFGKAVLQ